MKDSAMRFILTFILISITLIILKKLLKCGIINPMKLLGNKIIDLSKKMLTKNFLYFCVSSWLIYTSAFFPDELINWHDETWDSICEHFIERFCMSLINIIYYIENNIYIIFQQIGDLFNFIYSLFLYTVLCSTCFIIWIILARLWWKKKNLYSAYPLALYGSFISPTVMVTREFNIGLPIFVTMIFIALWSAFYWSK